MVDQRKVAKTEELKQRFSGVNAAVLADFRGLNVQQMTDLRSRLRERSVEYMVVKNTLARLASMETSFKAASELFRGPVSIAFCRDDHTAAARVMTAFAREEPALKITGGILQGKVITAKDVERLATLPAKEVLLSLVLAGMKSPVAGMVGALGGILRSLLYTLKALEEKRRSGE